MRWQLVVSTVSAIGALAVVPVAVISPISHRVQINQQKASCEATLKSMALVMRIYSNNERGERYPSLTPRLDALAPDPDVERLFDSTTPYTGSDMPRDIVHSCFEMHDYYYLGYAVASDEDVEVFAKAFRQAHDAGLPLNTDIRDPNETDSEHRFQLYGLREGIQRAFYDDFNIGGCNPGGDALIQSKLPVLIEHVGMHDANKAHVLFLDGHVEYRQYPGEWPMTEKTIGLLGELEALTPRS